MMRRCACTFSGAICPEVVYAVRPPAAPPFAQSAQLVLAAYTPLLLESAKSLQAPAPLISHHGGIVDVPSPTIRSSTPKKPVTPARSAVRTNDPTIVFAPRFVSQAEARLGTPPSLAHLSHAKLSPP